MSDLEEVELASLEHQASALHGHAITEKNSTEKKKLMQQRKEIVDRAVKLRQKIQDSREEQARKEVEKLLKENKNEIVLYLDGQKVRIPDSLKIDFQFKPCEHKKTLPLKDFLNAFTFHENKRTPFPNSFLLTQWQILLQHEETREGSMNCSECRSQNPTIFRKEKPMGHISFVVRRLQ